MLAESSIETSFRRLKSFKHSYQILSEYFFVTVVIYYFHSVFAKMFIKCSAIKHWSRNLPTVSFDRSAIRLENMPCILYGSVSKFVVVFWNKELFIVPSPFVGGNRFSDKSFLADWVISLLLGGDIRKLENSFLSGT